MSRGQDQAWRGDQLEGTWLLTDLVRSLRPAYRARVGLPAGELLTWALAWSPGWAPGTVGLLGTPQPRLLLLGPAALFPVLSPACLLLLLLLLLLLGGH